MTISKDIKEKINTLKQEYDSLKKDKESLLDIVFESELPESVYNSNAIENSTLTISETEKILWLKLTSGPKTLIPIFCASPR